ncbi:MAG: ester cyclase [Acidobacteriota bacterium]|nr:ester cyclase [Acidobacteriota bacterium]
MSATENTALMKRWFEEIWNHGRMETVRELLDETATGFGQAGHETEVHGPAGFITFAQRIRGAFPDIKTTVEDVFGSDDKVAVRWSANMTHTGGDLGIPPSHRKVHITGMTMVRFANGKIVEGWDNWDQLALMRQIGAVPEAHESHPTLIDPQNVQKGAAGN